MKASDEDKLLADDRLAYLNSKIEYFGADPKGRRATDPGTGNCQYRTSDGRKCAIGLDIPDNEYDSHMDDVWDYDKVLSFLPENIRRLGRVFLAQVQTLHDNANHWNLEATGLTYDGLRYVDYLKRRYYLDQYKQTD